MKKLEKLKNSDINQNGYHKNILTKERIGTLFIYPVDFTPEDCLACNGYSLNIADYEELYKVIGTKFNYFDDPLGTFRIPDYNITGRFLQPNTDVGKQIEAGLPEIYGKIGSTFRGLTGIASGAFALSGDNAVDYGVGGGTYSTSKTAIFSAKRYSSIYGNSKTVQPSSQTVHICIKYK